MKHRILITIGLSTAVILVGYLFISSLYTPSITQPEAPITTDEEPFIRDEYGNMTG